MVSFGTSSEEMRQRAIDPLEREIAAAFPDRVAYAAWESTRIVEKLRQERSEVHMTLPEALARIAEDGISDLVVQPTFLIRGAEMQELEAKLAAWQPAHTTVRLGAPLLASASDRSALVGMLAEEFAVLGPEDMLVVMGHGSYYGGNEVYFHMNEEFKARGLSHFFIATLKDELPFSAAIEAVEARQPKQVHLVPLMMVAGRHATVDMEGANPQSWESQLKARGYAVRCYRRGLGELPAVRELLAQHAQEALIIDEKCAKAESAEGEQ